MQQGPDGQPDAISEAWQSFEIVKGAPGTSLLIICDHATNLLPAGYGTLGLDETQLKRHIGYDIGALAVALGIGQRLQATVIFSRFSRLLIDPNRGEDDPTLIMQISDGAIVPGNAALGMTERARRIGAFYKPYHSAISGELDAMFARGLVPIIASIHSFTEAWRGVPRKWNAAVLWDKDPRLALPLLDGLRERTGFEIGDNEPYSGYLRNDSIYRHATVRGLPNALIEIRQDLIREAEGQLNWAALIAECLSSIVRAPENAGQLSQIQHYGSHTDKTAQR